MPSLIDNIDRGAWDDLRTDRRAGDDIYVVTPNEDTIIFRWQAVTYDTPLAPGVTRGENPVNFEVELQRNGAVVFRYGNGNQRLFPVVGLGGGFPDPYVVDSHTSERSLKDLTNAATVTFALHLPPPPPTANVTLSMTNGPNPAPSGGQQTYNVQIYNGGPFDARNAVVTDQLPAGLAFVSCTTNRGTCSTPAQGQNGTVTVNLGQLDSGQTASITIVAQVTATAGSTLTNTVSVAHSRFDNNLTDNSATAVTQVVDNLVFGNVASIATALVRNFAIKQDGSVWAWGRGDFGGLGDGAYTALRANPVPLSVSGVASVSAGYSHTLAVKTDGTVAGWGYNSAGQLFGNSPSYPSPLAIPGLANITAVAAGYQHSLALKNDGTVLAWGANDSGQLGQGTVDSNSHPVPAQVPGLTNVIAIAANNNYCLALRSDGSVWSWTSNSNGQLGTVDANNVRSTAAQVPGVSSVQSIVAGYNHVLAIKTDGTVWGWGANAFGQTGSTNYDNVNSTPTQVVNLGNVVAVGPGFGFSLAVRSDGTVWGWGLNGLGQLGNGTMGSNPQPTATQVSGISSGVAVGAGNAHGLVLLSDGTLRAWGDNQYSQLGDGTTFNRLTPVQVTGLLVVAQPVITPGDRTTHPPLEVTVSCDTPGATIHYTTNGQDPTESDPTVGADGRIVITQSVTLKAKAFKNGWTSSSVSSATYTVLALPNPIDNATTFVRQQYLDFLGREPDQGGWNYWGAQISDCGTDALCVHQRRIGVSGAFFVELEFQRTGYVVYRMHRAAFGSAANAPTLANLTFTQFMTDRPLVIDGPGLPQSTIDFANGFVQRSAFLVAYPLSQTNSQFVNKVFDTAGLTPFTTERQQQIEAMNNNGKTRAQVLLDVIEIAEFKTREYNRSFVLMQYFGYLRRDPDFGGYNFWLNILDNREPNNYRGMICSFLTSAEYQQRFGTTVSRTNADCAQ